MSNWYSFNAHHKIPFATCKSALTIEILDLHSFNLFAALNSFQVEFSAFQTGYFAIHLIDLNVGMYNWPVAWVINRYRAYRPLRVRRESRTGVLAKTSSCRVHIVNCRYCRGNTDRRPLITTICDAISAGYIMQTEQVSFERSRTSDIFRRNRDVLEEARDDWNCWLNFDTVLPAPGTLFRCLSSLASFVARARAFLTELCRGWSEPEDPYF